MSDNLNALITSVATLGAQNLSLTSQLDTAVNLNTTLLNRVAELERRVGAYEIEVKKLTLSLRAASRTPRSANSRGRVRSRLDRRGGADATPIPMAGSDEDPVASASDSSTEDEAPEDAVDGPARYSRNAKNTRVCHCGDARCRGGAMGQSCQGCNVKNWNLITDAMDGPPTIDKLASVLESLEAVKCPYEPADVDWKTHFLESYPVLIAAAPAGNATELVPLGDEGGGRPLQYRAHIAPFSSVVRMQFLVERKLRGNIESLAL